MFHALQEDDKELSVQEAMTAGEEISCPNRAPKPWVSEMKSISSIPTLIEYIYSVFETQQDRHRQHHHYWYSASFKFFRASLAPKTARQISSSVITSARPH